MVFPAVTGGAVRRGGNMARNTPTIRAGQAGVLILEAPAGGRRKEVPPESDAWFRWLESARTFIFEESGGRFTARKRRRWGSDYWYAFRRGSGRLYETYLGKARDITLGRLHTTLTKLNGLARQASRARTAPVRESVEAPHAGAGAGERERISSLVSPLSVPQVRLSQLVRTAAVDRLAQEGNCPLTVVSAPAGYGKTTALAQLVATLNVPAAWVSLDERDNDPARFWARVFAALEHVIPGLYEQGRATHTTHEAPDLSATDRVLDALADRQPQAQASAPTLLILDDYHELHSENHVIHDAVAFLVEHLPPQVRLVVACRTVPPLPLAKLRARDQLLELGTADLRLTLAETRALLDKRTGLDLSDEDIAVLHARTEGWVSALQLAALSLREQSDPRGWIAGFSGENRYIFDYLVQEVVKYIPSHMYDFALHVAPLDRLCGPLCDAVTRRSDSQAMLEEMERYNLFLVPLDDRREWYRLHHLFADVLRRHLRQTRSRSVPRLYARASAWCEAHGLALDAIDYAFEAHELEEEHTAQLVEGYAPTALANGYFVLLCERLERLPDRLVRERPVLAVAHAYALFMTGDRWVWLRRTREAEEAFARTEHLLDVPEREIVRAQIVTLRTATQCTLGESSPRETITALRQAQAVLPREHAFQTVNTLYLGIAQLLDGDVRAARKTFEDLMHASEASGNRFFVAYTVLLFGTVLVTLGRLDDALALADRVARRLDGYGDENLEALVHVLRGRALYERNDLEQALRGLEYGTSSLRYNRGNYVMEYAPTLAYTQLALGDSDAAHQTIDAAFAEWEASQAEQRPLLVWGGRHILAHRARLWLLEGDIEAAAAWASGRTSSGDAPAASTAEQSPYAREWEEIVLARLYLAEHRASDALALLDRLDEAARAGGRVSRLLEILVLKAVALDDLGDSAAALRELQRAVELSKPQGFVRTFVEGGPVIGRLLSRLLVESTPRGKAERGRKTAGLRPYMTSLLEATAPDEPTAGALHMRRAPAALNGAGGAGLAAPPTLTKQQRVIIHLIADGASNEDIAQALVITRGTAKRHVSNIFARLDVHSRTQAVAKARELGYFTGDDQDTTPSDADC